MRLAVQHTETLTYETPSMGTIQVLRMTPRDYKGHYVCEWSVDVDADCRMNTSTDAFGNILTSFSLGGPLDTLTITAMGEVETEETHGIILGAAEKVPEGVFLRSGMSDNDTSLVRTLLNAASDAPGPALGKVHHLMAALHSALPASHAEGTAQTDQPAPSQMQAHASEAWHRTARQQQSAVASPSDPAALSDEAMAMRRLRSVFAERKVAGGPQVAHLLCEAARQLGFPARLVTGYRLLEGPSRQMSAPDIWAEVLVEELGWVGFDALHNHCPSGESVRVAVGLDLPGIATMRVGHYGGISTYERETSIAVRQIGG